MFKDLIVKRMGKDKEPILKIKTQDFKKLSKQFEDEAKKKSEHKLKVKKLNLNIHRGLEKPMIIYEGEPNREYATVHEEKKTFTKFQNDENSLLLKYKMLMSRNTKKEIIALTPEENRLEREKEIVINQLKQFFTNYEREFHYFFNSRLPRKKYQITAFTDNTEIQTSFEETIILEEDYLNSYDKLLLGIKNLARYDCWEDKSPFEWVELCKRNGEDEYDGISPIYGENGYEWRRVKVLDYDDIKCKYKIYFSTSDQEKFVSRLSLRFFCENQAEFEYRKFLCEMRRSIVTDFLLFTRYVDNVPLELISDLNERYEHKILSFVHHCTKNLSIKYNYLFNPRRDKLVRELTIVKQDYIRQMKKCRLLIEMQEPDNKAAFNKRRLQIRSFYRKVTTPICGIELPGNRKSNSMNFKNTFHILNKKSFFEDQELTKVTVEFLKGCEFLKKIKLLPYKFHSNTLPLTISNFILIRDEHIKKADYSINTKCIFDLKSLIMDSLGDIETETNKKKNKKYNFFMVEHKNYPDSLVKKILQYFNLILQNKIKDLIEISISDFMDFMKRFTKSERKEVNLEGYLESTVPLFVTEIKSKEYDTKEKTAPRKVQIIFEPKLQEFSNNLFLSFRQIKDVINKISDLMSQSMRVIELDRKNIFELNDDYEIYANSLKELNFIYEQGETEAKAVRESFKKYEKLLARSVDSYINKKLGTREKTDKNLDIEKCKQLLEKFSSKLREVQSLESEINLRLFRIRTNDIKASLVDKITLIKNGIVERMTHYSLSRMKDLHNESEERKKILNEDPGDINHYKILYDIIQDTVYFVETKKKELYNIDQIIQINENQLSPVSNILFETLMNYWNLPQILMEALSKGNVNMAAKREELQEKLKLKNEVFCKNVKKLESDFDFIQTVNSFEYSDDKSNNFYYVITDFASTLQEANKDKEEIKKAFKILNPEMAQEIDEGYDPGKFEKLDQINKEFTGYRIVWEEKQEKIDNYSRNVQEQPLSMLKDQILQQVNSTKEVFAYVKGLEESRMKIDEVAKKNSGDATLISLTNNLKERIKYLESFSWIVQSLNSNFLHEEDFKEIRAIMNDNTITQKLTLEQLKNKGINDYKERIEMIRNKAARRHGYYIDLKELNVAYEAITFIAPKDDKRILKGIDDIQIMLDEQTNKLIDILSNPVTQSDAKLKYETRQQSEKIKNVQLVLEEIVKFQNNYFYLEPIFKVETTKQLSDYYMDFQKVDSFWKASFSIIENSGFVLSSYMEKENVSNMTKNFSDKNADMGQIIIKLNIYLNVKRTFFPRFYFISDEDLMKILAQSKNPLLIQPHINKCFEGIYRVVFNEDSTIISAMESYGGETVELEKKININDEMTRGNVEIWLGQLESSMKMTVENLTRKSLEDIQQKKRIDWIQSNWPGQIVQTVDQIMWTRQSIVAIKSNMLDDFLFQLDDDIKDIVGLVRTDVSKSLSITLSALIVVSVHNRDVIEHLKNKYINSTEEFDWIAQMRYDWNENRTKKKQSDQICPLVIEMVNSKINYGFEYLGNISRLVITPLTDRCFRTLAGAYSVKYGGAPEGPAGTGKTESVKDLSKAVGIMCNVFNCTEGIKIQGMSKFFKGLASSGCWCCFDEFNRIDTEVLSVIAQQILSIQNALKANISNFLFEDSEMIVLKDTCAINITMNPSYSGRNVLPDNLKSLFRPCAMMIADYNLIAQIKLYSFGFENAKILSNKIVSSLMLSSQQLSTQHHYDFGMRSLNAILIAAGKLKKKNPNLDEDRIALRALIDVNIPKFTNNDSPLFFGIIGDLFPTTNVMESDLSVLEDEIRNNCRLTNLVPTKSFVKKCIQLYETMNVRHALMVVGRSGMAKSKVLQTLKQSISDLKGFIGYNTVEVNILNPKSLDQKLLYGYFDINKEWKKGLLQVKMSELCEKEKDIFKWLIFDGPVDTLWIENMNSLLDDNKKLCLEDSSSISLGQNMNIIFEVDDLKEASPATVSRNGMVLCENDIIDISDLIESYSFTLPQIVFDQKLSSAFKDISGYIFRAIIEYVFKYGQFGLPTDKFHLVKCFLDIFESFICEYRNADMILTKEKEIGFEKLENLIIFSSLCGILGPVKRMPKIQEFLYELALGNDVNILFDLNIPEWTPKKLIAKIHDFEDIQDMVYILGQNKWIKWTDLPNRIEFKLSEDLRFSQLVIPTTDTIKMNWLINELAPLKKHILITGNTGTGKTLTILNTLTSTYENEHRTFIKMSFTAQTSVKFAQEVIEGKMQKSYRKFSPTNSRKGIIFVDDLNMPQKEKFGAQPPIELLRQWMDYNGWYDNNSDTKDFIQIVDVSFIASMGSVASGRTISQRYLRHFVVLFTESYSQQTMNKIFSNVVDWFFLKNKNPRFNNSITSFKDSLINSTIQLYTSTSNLFKATPAKTHYTFNLRDLGRVFQGISQATSISITNEVDLIKLWIHECDRVFKDRLVNDIDRTTYEQTLSTIMKSSMKRDYLSYLKDGSIIFGDFVPMIRYDNDPKKPFIRKLYCELSDRQLLKNELEDKLEKYNEHMKGENSLNLVLFPYAIEHVTKILRILGTPNGNALLVGVGGSGRRSLTQLATFINEYTPFSVGSNDIVKSKWREQLRELIIDYALTGKETVFFLSDSQISDDFYLEDINNMLNNGEIPNLLDSNNLQTYKENIPAEFTMNKKLNSDSEILASLVELCKAKIHFVICMSPIGESFRKRILMFPSLVNCTTIDWFLPWPEEGLSAVAEHYLADYKDVNQSYLNNIIKICVDMQSRVIKYSEKYMLELRRHNYVTPMSFIELLNLFKTLLSKRSSEIKKEIVSYDRGLKILEVSEEITAKMSNYIKEELNPTLEREKKNCEEKTKTLNELKDRLVIDELEGQKAEEEGIIYDNESREKNEIATEKLKNIEGFRNESQEKANSIRQDDCSLLQKSANDPIVSELCRFLCMLMLKNPHPKPVQKSLNPKDPPVKDYHNHAVTGIIAKPQFLKRLREFDSTKMLRDNMLELQKEIELATFNPLRKSQEFQNLYDFIKIQNRIFFINEDYLPIKEMAEKALKEYSESQESLKKVRQKLADTIKLKADKEDEKAATDRRIEELNKELVRCNNRLNNSKDLLSSLANEKENWKKRKEELENFYKNIIGNILISSGIIAYLGAFTKSYREEIIETWAELILKQNIPLTTTEPPTLIMQKILSDNMEIETWKTQKLPNDYFSVDNAIIISQSRRSSLLIDPQNQAFEWLQQKAKVEGELIYNELMKQEMSYGIKKGKKNKEIPDFFYEVKPIMEQSSQNKIIIECLKSGHTLLYSNLGENIPSIMAPIYKKEYSRLQTIEFNGTSIDVHENFRFYMSTNLPKPHYMPDICSVCTIVNFTVTEEGLEDQMLNFLIEREDPATDQQRKYCIEKLNLVNKKKKEFEREILQMLNSNSNTNAESTILDNTDLIQKLRMSRESSKEMEKTILNQKETEKSIEIKRTSFRPAATHVAQLFFTLSDLSNIEPVYQYSLKFFKDIFNKSIEETLNQNIQEKSVKVDAYRENFTSLLYDKICLSLFEKDKIVFSFLLAIKINMIPMSPEQKAQYTKECRLLVTGGSGKEFNIHNPTTNHESWLTNTAWNSICELSNSSPIFKELVNSFISETDKWKRVMTSSSSIEEKFPEQFDSLEFFHKLMIIRIIRPEQAVSLIKNYISTKIGSKYTTAPSFDVGKAYSESKNDTPILFILSPGADPLVIIQSLCLNSQMDWDRVRNISLGQGQEEAAKAGIEAGIQRNSWIILQNCHLAKSFMNELEKIVDNISYNSESRFRLFLTTLPSKVIPISIMQNSIKLTNEPPRGLKQSMLRSYGTINPKDYESGKNVSLIKRFIYSFTFFHALILERRKYGPLGWNIPYEFSNSDLSISITQMKNFIDSDLDQIPWDALSYMIAEANYGGRVTDPADRRLIKITFDDFCNSGLLNNSFRFFGMKEYTIPQEGKYDDHLKFISNINDDDAPSLFGLHENANINYAINETNSVLDSALLTLPRIVSVKTGVSAEDEVKSKALDLLQRIPPKYDIENVMKLIPLKHAESLNSVLHQELMRYNNLIDVIQSSLKNLIDSINGDAVMTSELEQILQKIYDNKIPSNIEKVSYPSVKSFTSWFNDLLERLKFMQKWIDEGIPKTFWISGFFFTQSFLTGILQNYARKSMIPIDELQFSFEIMTDLGQYNLNESPNDGCYVYGFYLEGARWNSGKIYF